MFMKMSLIALAACTCLINLNAVADDENYSGESIFIGVGAGYSTFGGTLDAYSADVSPYLQIGLTLTPSVSVELYYSRSTTPGEIDLYDNQDLTESVKDLYLAYSYDPQDVASINSVSAQLHNNHQLSIESSAIYLSYRTTGDFYAKLKAGYIYNAFEKQHFADGKITFDLADSASNSFKNDVFETQEAFSRSYKDSSESRPGLTGQFHDSDYLIGLGLGYALSPQVMTEVEATRLFDDFYRYSVGVNYYF